MFTNRRNLGARSNSPLGVLAALVVCAAIGAFPALSLVHAWAHDLGDHAQLDASHAHDDSAAHAHPHSGEPEDTHDGHDHHTCKTCLELLLVKLTTTIAVLPAPHFAPEFADAVALVQSLEPSLRSLLTAMPRGPPRALAA